MQMQTRQIQSVSLASNRSWSSICDTALSNGSLRAAISSSTTPRDHTSAATPYPAPASLSGDMYRIVPIIVCARSCSHQLLEQERVGGGREGGKRYCLLASVSVSLFVSLSLVRAWNFSIGVRYLARKGGLHHRVWNAENLTISPSNSRAIPKSLSFTSPLLQHTRPKTTATITGRKTKQKSKVRQSEARAGSWNAREGEVTVSEASSFSWGSDEDKQQRKRSPAFFPVKHPKHSPPPPPISYE